MKFDFCNTQRQMILNKKKSVKNKGTVSHCYSNMATCYKKLRPGGKYRFKVKCDGGSCLRYVGCCTNPKYVIPGSKYIKKKSIQKF